MIKLQKESYRWERTMECCGCIKVTDEGKDEGKFAFKFLNDANIPIVYFSIDQLKELKTGLDQFIEAVELGGKLLDFKKKGKLDGNNVNIEKPQGN